MSNTTGMEVSASPQAASTQILQAATFPLWGSRLIEASAGTGKTWTIAALYLRLVLGHGGAQGFERALRPVDILVMTFTRAATRELSDRIRDRLLTAARWFRGHRPDDANDPFLDTLLADYVEGKARERAAWLLTNAADSMDDASVHTIDAWCQRMLKEHAFDSGCLFDEELVADEDTMRVQATQDYWRQSCYPMTLEQLEHVLGAWKNVDALVDDMKDLLSQDIASEYGAGTLAETLQKATIERCNALAELRSGWSQRATDMQDWLDSQMAVNKGDWDGRRLSLKNCSGWLKTLKDWADGVLEVDVPDLKTGWERFTPEGLLSARKAGAPPIDLPPVFAEFESLKPACLKLPSIRTALRLHAAANVSTRLLQLKRQSSSFGFADMLNRLNSALSGSNGERLRERVLAQYPVAMIDEFQDTSPLQYQIFDQIYHTQSNDPQSALLLIGDPKQSIYGFRGADIYSYMKARHATDGRHYVLETNYRSTQTMVDVVNHWFCQADASRTEGAFMYRNGAENPLPYVKVQANGRKETLVSSGQPVPAMTLVHDLEIRNSEGSRKVFAAQCAEQIVTWLNDESAGFSEKDKPFERLRPADIAVLVRTGKEANAVRKELAKRSVASVYLSDKDSVFDSDVAKDLVHWLRAVAAPQDVRLVRAGLATATIGLSLDEMGWLASNDDAFDARNEQLRQLRTIWQTQGVLAMLRQTLHQLGLGVRWLEDIDGERRLTNFLHLAELLQSASSALDGEQSLIRWLQTEITEGGAQGDEQVVRLESDADLVKVITIHKSKGLEYSVVCLPYATSFRKKESKYTSFVMLADEDGNRVLHLDYDKDALTVADRDRLREDLRLLYVALTRARHALWLGFSALKKGISTACISHDSGAGYLLGGPEPIAAADWLSHLEQLAAGESGIALKAVDKSLACTVLSRTDHQSDLQESPLYQAEFERDWKIGSFSQLTRDLAGAQSGSELSRLQMPRPADDEASATDEYRVQTSVTPAIATSAQSWHKFPKGAEPGNFLHEQLEWLTTENFALADNEPLIERLQKRCERAGRGAFGATVADWLTEVVKTRLPGPNVTLSELVQVLPEMEFWLPADRMDASQIDAHCREHVLKGVDRPALAQRQLHGMLMGFADLVFEHQGKYWVLDYKSNYLGQDDSAYDQDALALAMAHHRYDVQAAIYMLALDRLLKLRLGQSYQPEHHLGGAVYLFLRGIKGPQNGVCLIPACHPLMNKLDSMLAKTGAMA